MQNPFLISLIVSGFGLLLLFLALAFLYGVMYLMTEVLKDRPTVSMPPTEEIEGGPKDKEMALRAAAVAVALARAEREWYATGTQAVNGVTGHQRTSHWWALHHQRQLTRKPSTRRAR